MSDKTLLSIAGATVIGLAAAMFVAWPYYNVWIADMNGKARTVQAEHEGAARLSQAESEKKIMIEQARAEKEAATLRAEAIQIVGKVAKEYPEYRQQEFIGAFSEALKEGNIKQIIYVPTEANIPITEAGRISHLGEQ